MKKITLFLMAIVCLFSFNSFAADMAFMKNFYVGPFKLNQANWNTFFDGNFLGGISSLPETKSFKVFGYSDKSGPEEFNQKLSMERANLVADKLKRLFPDSEVNVFGKIYKPEDGQKVDYRMVLVEVYANPQVVLADLKASLENISAMINEIKSKPETKLEVTEQKVDLSSLEEQLKLVSQSISDLKNSQFDLSKMNLEDKDFTLAEIEKIFSALSLSFSEIQAEQKAMFEFFKKENEDLKNSINVTSNKVDMLIDKFNSVSEKTKAEKANVWIYVLFLLMLLVLFIIILALVDRKSKRKVPEDVFEWVQINVSTPAEIREMSVKCKKIGDSYISPIRGFEYKNIKDLKQSLKSYLSNYFRDGEKSASFVEAKLGEKIAFLIESGEINLGEES